ncbi:MAG TPA: Gfo/Idh/MocA family oxidoreductase [Vicinamibacterales bacterium]|nr:Gfo/Idh/MocA family oxidoreductase [Vicinamibacterales bacterium]
MSDPNRREFLKTGAAAVAGAAAIGALRGDAAAAEQAAYSGEFSVPPIELVRIGYVGIGLQGSSHVTNLNRIPGCRITAVCDIRSEQTDWAARQITAAGHPAPAVYNKGPRDFERLCETEDLDLVYTATPWEWHVPVLLAAMKNGKHAATEVPAAMTLDDCWAMVETAEKQRRHCVLMENCNYDRMEMMAYNMVRQGLFGEILHAEGGYLHDLRQIKFENKNEGLWRRAWSMKLNGNLYPTHGLGPIAHCLDINRGDRFDYLVSMSSPSRGLQNWAVDHFPAGAPQRQEKYVLGDVNTSLIKTANGKTIMVQHCTNLPRPYSRINIVQGTKGLFEGYPHRAYIEGRGRADQWVDANTLLAEFEHPLWKEIAAQAQGAGHGGMDFIEDYRLIKCLREGAPLDQTVYDAAALSAVVDLSVRSVAKAGQPVPVPDFTRGRWKTTAPLGIVHM